VAVTLKPGTGLRYCPPPRQLVDQVHRDGLTFGNDQVGPGICIVLQNLTVLEWRPGRSRRRTVAAVAPRIQRGAVGWLIYAACAVRLNVGPVIPEPRPVPPAESKTVSAARGKQEVVASSKCPLSRHANIAAPLVTWNSVIRPPNSPRRSTGDPDWACTGNSPRRHGGRTRRGRIGGRRAHKTSIQDHIQRFAPCQRDRVGREYMLLPACRAAAWRCSRHLHRTPVRPASGTQRHRDPRS